MSNVIHVNESAFDRHILNHKGIVLVDFWAPWCGPCKTLGPILDNVSTKVSHKIVKVNVDEESNLANKYKIRSIPTMIVFKDGKAIDTMVGVISEEA
jgi:thioredoxin 1